MNDEGGRYHHFSVNCGGAPLTFLVSEETAPADDLGNLRRHHLVPAFVSGGDALEHVARKYRQIFGIIVIKLDETAASDEISVERLQVGFHLQGVNGF